MYFVCSWIWCLNDYSHKGCLFANGRCGVYALCVESYFLGLHYTKSLRFRLCHLHKHAPMTTLVHFVIILPLSIQGCHSKFLDFRSKSQMVHIVSFYIFLISVRSTYSFCASALYSSSLVVTATGHPCLFKSFRGRGPFILLNCGISEAVFMIWRWSIRVKADHLQQLTLFRYRAHVPNLIITQRYRKGNNEWCGFQPELFLRIFWSFLCSLFLGILWRTYYPYTTFSNCIIDFLGIFLNNQETFCLQTGPVLCRSFRVIFQATVA